MGGLPFGSPPVLYKWRYSGGSERKFIVFFGWNSLGARLGHNFFTCQKTAVFQPFLLKKGSFSSVFQNRPRLQVQQAEAYSTSVECKNKQIWTIFSVILPVFEGLNVKFYDEGRGAGMNSGTPRFISVLAWDGVRFWKRKDKPAPTGKLPVGAGFCCIQFNLFYIIVW